VDSARGAKKDRASPKGRRRRWDTLTDWARAQGEIILRPLIEALASLGLHPNTITILGALLQTGVGVVFALGRLQLAGWLLLAVAPIDALDGALARATGRRSTFGAFLDSTLDRVSDAAVILGLTAHYMRQGAHVQVALLLAALVASLLVSYVRARAEALGYSCKVGVLTRVERIALIGALSALGLAGYMVWALAILSVFTVVQRILRVYALSRQESGGE
jgi:CDP-diacylglycerol--glycerol-3-phosphate 3-phosphatidyltransferase